MAIGRPSKYNDQMPRLLIEAMTEGKSVTRFCADNDISKETFYRWVSENSLFNDAFREAKQKCESHWEKWLIAHLGDKNVNAGLVKMYFTNRFGWKDKQEVENKTEISISDNTQRKVRDVLNDACTEK